MDNQKCDKCNAEDHSGHTDNGRCKWDNHFNADCRCSWRPTMDERTLEVMGLPLAIILGIVLGLLV